MFIGLILADNILLSIVITGTVTRNTKYTTILANKDIVNEVDKELIQSMGKS